MFFKKELQILQNKTLELNKLCSQLKERNNSIIEQIIALENKQSRIEYLLSTKPICESKWCSQKTNKGVEVLSFIRHSGSSIEIEVFDLIEDYMVGRKLVLWAVERDDGIFIQDIQGGKSKGHGEVAMKHLLKMAESTNRIYGEISPVDYGHINRLSAFYKKMGFTVFSDPETRSGRVEKIL